MENNENNNLSSAELADLQETLAAREVEILQLKERLAYLSAEFENFKRRSHKDLMVWQRAGQVSAIKKMLAIVDQIDMAVSTAKAMGSEDSPWIAGLVLVQNNLDKTLKELGLQEIDCSGFLNPELHEAVGQEATEAIESGKIIKILSRGFLLDEKIVRHAQVVVAA